MGFYPVCPASDEYAAGVPAFSKLTVHREDGTRLVIIRDAKAGTSGISCDGSLLDRPFLSFKQLRTARTLSYGF